MRMPDDMVDVNVGWGKVVAALGDMHVGKGSRGEAELLWGKFGSSACASGSQHDVPRARDTSDGAGGCAQASATYRSGVKAKAIASR